jgi:hypothetical protein
LGKNRTEPNLLTPNLADGQPIDIMGIGDVQIKTMNRSIWNLQNVRHVPGLKKKLISVRQLDDSGHSILFSGGMWKVSKGAMVLARGKKTGTLYITTRFADICHNPIFDHFILIIIIILFTEKDKK